MADTIERKKKKDGIYEYFIADNDGKKLETLTVDGMDICEGREVDELFYLATYLDKRDESETIKRDAKGDYTTNTEGEGDIAVKALLWNDGSSIFKGIKRLVQNIRNKQEFIIVLERQLIERHKLNEEEKRKLNASYKSTSTINDKEIFCVIDDGGNFVISPTYQQIHYDSIAEDYIVVD